MSSTLIQLTVQFFNETKRKNSIHHRDSELAGHVHNLDVKLQSLWESGISQFAVRVLAKPYHFGVNWPATLCENKDGVHFFTLKFECHNRYSKLLLCTSGNGDIAWWTTTIYNGVFVYVKKTNKNLFLFKKTKKSDENKQKTGGLFFFKNGFFSTLIVFQSFLWFALDRTIWNK